jgi:AcrR family transcriptional regulator
VFGYCLGVGVAERRIREKEALRQQILDAATELFVSEGINNVSIRKIADKIEYAPSTIYLYFKDKMDILITICTGVFDQLTEILHEIERLPEPSILRLRKGLRAYIDFGLAHPQHYQLTFGQPWGIPPEECLVPSEADLAGLRTFACLQRALQTCMDDGSVERQDLGLVSQAVWMQIHGLTHMLNMSPYIPNFPWADRDETIESTLDRILRSLRPA